MRGVLVSIAAATGILLGVSLCRAQPPAAIEIDQARAVVEQFFSKLQEGKTDDAFEYLANQNPSMGSRRDDLEKARAGFFGMIRLVGGYQGHERLFEKVVASRYVHMTYFAYFDRQPIRFRFELYRPKDVWQLHSFNFDDVFMAEIRDALKRRWE